MLAVSREQASDRAELWRLSGERIERVASYGGLRSSALLGEVLILETLAIEQNGHVISLRGMSLEGTQLWDSRHVGLASTRVDGQLPIMACYAGARSCSPVKNWAYEEPPTIFAQHERAAVTDCTIEGLADARQMSV